MLALWLGIGIALTGGYAVCVNSADAEETDISAFYSQAAADTTENDLEECMNENSIYPSFCKVIKEYEAAGYDEDEAITATIDSKIKNAAFMAYAQNKGFVLSDKKVKHLMDENLIEIKNAEKFKDCERIYEQQGLSFEEEYWKDFDTYKVSYTVDNLYQKMLEGYTDGKGKMRLEDQDDFEKTWAKFEKKVIKDYMNSDDYLLLQEALVEAETAYNMGVDEKSISTTEEEQLTQDDQSDVIDFESMNVKDEIL